MSVATKLQVGDDCAWVSCDGKPLPVYHIEASGNKTTAWIPSEAGKAFTVTVQCLNHKDAICAQTSVDGTRVANSRVDNGSNSPVVIEGVYAGKAVVRPMHFAVITTSDDEFHCMGATALLSKLGTIGIEFFRVQVIRPSLTSDPNLAKSLDQTVIVHEKQKKLGGHHTILGAPKQLAKATQFVTSRNIDPAPRTVLEFKYRPKELLQAQDIIPVVRAPSPAIFSSSQTNKRHLNEDIMDDSSRCREPPAKRVKLEDSEYTRRLEEHIRKLHSQLPGNHSLMSDSPVVKSEPAEINAYNFFKKGEIIDLTDD